VVWRKSRKRLRKREKVSLMGMLRMAFCSTFYHLPHLDDLRLHRAAASASTRVFSSPESLANQATTSSRRRPAFASLSGPPQPPSTARRSAVQRPRAFAAPRAKVCEICEFEGREPFDPPTTEPSRRFMMGPEFLVSSRNKRKEKEKARGLMRKRERKNIQ
jgi:hypothetical protein